jgi:hypothetical protein
MESGTLDCASIRPKSFSANILSAAQDPPAQLALVIGRNPLR